jgi:hypothetical protein
MELIPMKVAPVPPAMMIECKLEAQQWNAVILGLAELPLKISGPIVDALTAQLKGAAEKMPAPVRPASAVLVDPIPHASPAADWLRNQEGSGSLQVKP